MKKVIWQITHGVEIDLPPDYAQKHIDKVMAHISPIYREFIIPHSTNWSVLVESRQNITWEMENDLAWPWLRKRLIEIVCDLLWYEQMKDEIQGKIELELNLLATANPGCYIIRQGHSLGSKIMLDACTWSKHQTDALITMGSPITKYAGMYKDWGKLPENELDFWVNFYSHFDLVAATFRKHPVQAFRDKVEDVKASSYNPINMLKFPAHLMYWDNDGVCKNIAQKLENFICKVNN